MTIRTLGVSNSRDEVPLGQFAEILVHTSVPKPGNLNDEGGRHDFMVFGAHLDLAWPAINYRLRIHKMAGKNSIQQSRRGTLRR